MARSFQDAQRNKVYDAEATVRASWRRKAAGSPAASAASAVDMVREMSETEIQEMCDLVCDTFNAPRLRSIGYRGNTRFSTYYSGGRIVLASWGRKRWTVLHELAHHVNDTAGKMSRAPGHGAEWVFTHLAIAEMFGEPGYADDLRREYRAAGVRMIPGPEQARTFLNMARRKEMPSQRRIQYLTADGESKRGCRIIEWDGEYLTLARDPLSHETPDIQGLNGESLVFARTIHIEDLRYVTFIDPEPKPHICPVCGKGYQTQAKLATHLHRARFGRGYDGDAHEDYFWRQ